MEFCLILRPGLFLQWYGLEIFKLLFLCIPGLNTYTKFLTVEEGS